MHNLYVVQPLKESTLSFCLACDERNNTFTAQNVLQRWIYIYNKLKKRGVNIISFAADGDSGLMHAMQANSECFLPWMFGSQSCEIVFHFLQRMTGTFSTSVYFSLLGKLQRLHKLYIQEECQSKAGNASGICFPKQEECGHKKDGSKQYKKTYEA